MDVKRLLEEKAGKAWFEWEVDQIEKGRREPLPNSPEVWADRGIKTWFPKVDLIYKLYGRLSVDLLVNITALKRRKAEDMVVTYFDIRKENDDEGISSL